MAGRDYPRINVPPPGPKAQAIVDRDAEWTSSCYIKEYPLERYLRDARVHQILEGTNEIMRVIIARRLLEKADLEIPR